MDLFRIIFKRILYNIPLKLLLLITIALILLLLFTSNVFASDISTTSYNNNTYTFFIPDNAWGVIQQLPEYTSGDYDYLFYCSSGYCYIYFWSNSLTQNFYNNITSNPTNFNKFYHTNNNITCHYYRIAENSTTIPDSYSEVSSSSMGTSAYSINNQLKAYFYTNKAIYTDNTLTTTFYSGVTPAFVDPYISDTSNINDMSFNYLMIEGGSEDFYINPGEPTRQRIFDLELDYQGYAYTMNINDYSIVGSDGSVGFAIPKYSLFPQLIFRNGETLSFSLVVTPSVSPNSTGDWSVYSLGTFTLTLTTDQEEQLEQDRQAQQVENINNSINNVDNSINNVNQSIEETNEKVEHLLDTNVDSSSVDGLFNISQDLNAPDGSHIDDFFLILYNAFCYNEVVNLTFTLPFVNKQVVISSANVSSFYPQALKDIVSTIAWGGIALFIAKDIRSMINKINEGRPEYIGHDIKKEVL